MECICYENSTRSYPTHTHAEHITIGCVLAGVVCIVREGKICFRHAGECFCIMPDIPHALESVNDTSYSMISVCVPVDKVPDKSENEMGYAKRLKQLILDEPDKLFLIEDMAQRIGVSPFHMIRRFKADCGLTPHQFQIQCRVRKAQRLLEEGKSVTEAAYVAGFCDQSHLDRCFRKFVRLTPNEYKQSVKLLD